jgi:pimeloyl-ACP methyl ester carboxylesterase
MFKYDVSRELSSIKVPTLIVAAEKDRLTKPIASEFMKKTPAECGTGDGCSCEPPRTH